MAGGCTAQSLHGSPGSIQEPCHSGISKIFPFRNWTKLAPLLGDGRGAVCHAEPGRGVRWPWGPAKCPYQLLLSHVGLHFPVGPKHPPPCVSSSRAPGLRFFFTMGKNIPSPRQGKRARASAPGTGYSASAVPLLLASAPFCTLTCITDGRIGACIQVTRVALCAYAESSADTHELRSLAAAVACK